MIYRLNGKRSTGHEYTMKKKELEDLGIDYDESDTQVQGNVIQRDITFSTKEKVGNLLNVKVKDNE